MEIKNSLLKNVDPYRATLDAKAEAVSQRARGQGENAAQPPAGDRVSLSSEALLQSAAREAASAAPDIRQDKVEAIKQRVDGGEYPVDARRIAEKLVRSEGLLAGTLSGD